MPHDGTLVSNASGQIFFNRTHKQPLDKPAPLRAGYHTPTRSSPPLPPKCDIPPLAYQKIGRRPGLGITPPAGGRLFFFLFLFFPLLSVFLKQSARRISFSLLSRRIPSVCLAKAGLGRRRGESGLLYQSPRVTVQPDIPPCHVTPLPSFIHTSSHSKL